MKVDVYIVPEAFRDGTCPPINSEPATLSGQAGWQESGVTTAEGATPYRLQAADYQGFRYCLIGYFADPPDPAVFDRIVDSFRFLE
jgi:hypothetical protein